MGRQEWVHEAMGQRMGGGSRRGEWRRGGGRRWGEGEERWWWGGERGWGEQEGDGDNKRPREGPTMASATLTEVAWAAARGDGRGDKGRGAWGSLVGVVYKGQGTT